MGSCAASWQSTRQALPARLEALREVHGVVGGQALQAGLDETTAALFTVACVEAFTNVVRHGRGRPPDALIELGVYIECEALVVELVHPGEAFDEPEPAPLDDPDGYADGGMGLHIMRLATDKVEHLHRGGINTVRLERRRSAHHA